jgi:hypothetical protein
MSLIFLLNPVFLRIGKTLLKLTFLGSSAYYLYQIYSNTSEIAGMTRLALEYDPVHDQDKALDFGDDDDENLR